MKNNFVRSKMNKDLDDRLLQPGEYRDATNVNISRSEGDDVGALENVLGNYLLTNFGKVNPNLEIIGYTTNTDTNGVYVFATDYTDESDNNLDNAAPYGATCYILYKEANNPPKTLVSGRFLNFSKTHKILCVDLIEDLMFWTDDRNQPRVINWQRALEDPSYYYSEDHISVAKYYPWQAPLLINEVEIDGTNLEWWDSGWPGDGDINISTYYKVLNKATIDKLRVGMEVTSYVNAGDEYYAYPKFRAFIVERYAPATLPGGESYYIKINIEQLPVQPNVADSPFVPYDDGSGDDYSLNKITFVAASSQDQFNRYLYPHQYISPDSIAADGLSFDSGSFSADEVLGGMQLTNSKKISNPPVITSVTETLNANGAIVDYNVTLDRPLNADGNDVEEGDFLMVSWFNPNFNSSWPGDRNQMEDKFIRFAYRFKFDDGEYSLISPFTQPAFIPKQNGYVVTEPIPNDADSFTKQDISIASTTTIKSFENSVNNVDVHLPFEYACNELADKLKVKEVDILYRESDSLAISVLETIPIDDESFTSNSTKTYVYDYQSKKPFRVLPEAETIRVFDKVPVRAKTQSVTGNRVIYGNILNQHTPPSELEYNVTISEKYTPGDYSKIAENYTAVNQSSTIPATSYPYHTVKQNRNYQVGIVLSDRYGRQSDVILSSITNFKQGQDGEVEEYDGSTVYHPYPDSPSDLIPANWRGDSIKVLFTNTIPSERTDAEGYPGIFSPQTYTREVNSDLSTGTTQAFEPVGTGNADKYSGIEIGDIFFGIDENDDEVMGVVQSVIAEGDATYPDGAIIYQSTSDENLKDGSLVTFHSPGNKLGWYSYKIVVKQLINEYYNLYLGSVTTINNNSQVKKNATAGFNPFAFDSYCTSLISDNVNKVPADLQKVAPEQVQFGTSDTLLYPRIGTTLGPIKKKYASQFYYGTKTASIAAYGKMLDLGLQDVDETETNGYPSSQGIWSASNNPTMIVLGMPNGESIGLEPVDTGERTLFAAMEVKAEPSKIDIYWETSTSGLVTELNNLVSDGPSSDPIPQDPDPFLPPIIEK